MNLLLKKARSGQNNGVDFKMDVRGADAQTLNYLWFVSPMLSKPDSNVFLYSILGRDVTDFTRATERSARMQVELATSKMYQETLFPQPFATFGKSSVAGFYESASECGGDWWHYCVANNKIYLWIGDVTGHGVAAALVTSAVYSAVTIILERDLSPSLALDYLNRSVRAVGGGKREMTFAVASVDLDSGECIYSSASHEVGFIIPAGKTNLTHRDFSLMKAEITVPLGSSTNSAFKEYRVQLKRGDRIVFYSDGVYDIMNANADRWSRSRYRQKLASLACSHSGTKDLVEGVRRAIDDYRQGSMLDDDVTFFAFQF